MTEKMYHIYAGNECLYYGLDSDEFKETWNNIKGIVGLMKTEYEIEDLSFEELNYSKSTICDSSH